MNTKETEVPFIILILSIFFFFVCLIFTCSKVTPQQPISRKIIMKQDSIESRTGFDPLNAKFFQYSATVYYLIADSGHSVEVGLSTYATVHVGQEYAASNWQLK